jgi:hypothetical protein
MSSVQRAERGVVNKLSVLFGLLAVLFLGLSVFAPPSWYEWIPTRGQEVVFPALFTTFLLGFMKETPVINNFFTERRRLAEEQQDKKRQTTRGGW